MEKAKQFREQEGRVARQLFHIEGSFLGKVEIFETLRAIANIQ